jgi:hypothetical protein
MITAAPSTALATSQPAFTDAERLALAGFLDLRIAVYSLRNTPGDGCRAPDTAGWLGRRLTAPVHRQGFAKMMKDIPGGSRRAAGQCRHLSRLLRRPRAGASGTAVIFMVHCRGLRWLTGRYVCPAGSGPPSANCLDEVTHDRRAVNGQD